MLLTEKIVQCVETLALELRALRTTQPLRAREIARAFELIEHCEHVHCLVHQIETVCLTVLKLADLDILLQRAMWRAIVNIKLLIIDNLEMA